MSYSVSIAMALYNGEKYLKEQLESIYTQTIQPGELVACDDGSIDNCNNVFLEFVVEKGLNEKWKIEKNEKQLGLIKNFIHCASLCRGDIIFFSDQDDVWKERKIEKMINVFEKHPEAEAVVCAYQSVGANLQEQKSLVESIKGKNNFSGKISKVPLTTQVKTMLSGGLTLAVKKSVLMEIAPYILENDLTYDIPIGLICAARGSLYRIDETLVLHRVHLSNSGAPELSIKNRLKNINRHIVGREFELKHLKSIIGAPGVNLSETELCKLNREIEAREKAIVYMKQRNIVRLFTSVFRINDYDNKTMDVANFLCTLWNLF